jgi:chaperonin GroES
VLINKNITYEIKEVVFMLKPIGDRLVIELVQSEEKTASGIVLPDSAKEKPQEGKVVAVGTGRVLDSGERVALEVSQGDSIIFSKYAGTEVKFEGKEYLILKETDVLAVVSK